mmetsp:Transcript_49175/g.111542  ORF Transcript_49175/g.111542 Transcript_49175/m.111542 type:complete len:421 (-) Transcript_49175:214-1476(-)
MEALFGPTLKGKDGDVSTSTALAGKVVGIYFSAHWCPPCRGFTPKLVESYNTMKAAGKNFEIVFVSSDNDEAGFDEYYGEMPWLALPFSDREKKGALSKKFGCRGIPMFVVVDEEGKTIVKDGRTAVTNDPAGANFPWRPKSVHELLGDTFRGPGGESVGKAALAGKTLALYFSAHWCPPCQGFTPVLAKVYKDMKASGRDDFEFVFISSDKDETQFNSYHDEMPWLALPFSKRDEKSKLSALFEVEGIPSLITIDPEGRVINKSARGGAGSPDAATTFPWAPKPSEELSATVECNGFDVNEKPALIVLCDGCDDAVKASAKTALEGVAAEHAAETKGREEGPELIFFTATADSGPVPQVKKLCGQPEGATSTPVFLLLDIPDDGGYYAVTPEEVTVASIKALMADYRAKSLPRQQMQRG